MVGMRMPTCQQLVTFALLVHDLSWITLRPEFGIPAMGLGLSLQTYITISSLLARSSDLFSQASLLFWLVGNVIWTFAEFIWDKGHPVGFLGNMNFFVTLSRKWYSTFMWCAITIQSLTCIALIGFYISHWARWRRQRGVTLPITSLVEPMVGSPTRPSALSSFTAPLPVVEAYVLVQWLPMRMYYELFTMPWILMDTFWVYFDALSVTNAQPGYIFVACSAFFGVAAISICIDCVRRLSATGQRSEIALYLAEAFWVGGNVTWMLQDSLSLWMWIKSAAIMQFAIGPFFVICSVLCTDDDLGESSTSTLNALDSTSTESLEAGLSVSLPPLITSVPDAIKKRQNLRPRKATSKLSRHVTILPKGLANQTSNFQGLLARLALNGTREPKQPITLFDLGHIHKKLLEWREALPRVRPYYAVHGHANKKVLQLLCQDRCSFACATADEVNRVLSLGANPDDIMFSEARKLKSHLNFVKEKGVQLMPFDDEAELRKIAAECPSARLLLQLAAPKGVSAIRGLAVQFGALQTEWAALLTLAAELGLKVVGVSLREGLDVEDSGLSEDSLKDAHEAFRMATEMGFSMDVLDLGSADIMNNPAYFDLAVTIEEQLSRWFPTETFSTLRVIASLGQLFTRRASMLLTQVIAKEVGGEGIHQYVLNAGLYDAFSSFLTDRTQPEPPSAVSLSAQERPEQRCRFLGPSQDPLDVVLKEAILPELEQGEWVLWPHVCAQPFTINTRSWSTNSDDAADDDEEIQKAKMWYYAEDGTLPVDLREC